MFVDRDVAHARAFDPARGSFFVRTTTTTPPRAGKTDEDAMPVGQRPRVQAYLKRCGR